MKVFLFGAVLLASLSYQAHAGTLQVQVVGAFDTLENEKIWKGIDQDEVPLAALQYRTIAEPSKAYQSLVPGKNHSQVYLQNERMIVCYESCEQAQPKIPVANGRVELKDLDANKWVSGKKRDEAWKAVKLMNVYYWTNALFDYLETLGYKPTRRLTVVVERNISDPSGGKAMTNNAFFTEIDWSLNFLPAKNNMIYKALGMNIHSAALDPSVAMHECTHSVFQDLIGSILNPSLFGLHEALADYFAMSVLNTRKIGIIFFSGKPIRTTVDENAEKKTVYKPGLEAHDLGNIVNTALQHIRLAIPEKKFADLVVLETVRELGQAPYIMATQIQSTFMNSLNKVAAGRNTTVAPETLTKIAGVWKTYNIQSIPSYGQIPASYFSAAKNTSGFFEVTVETRLPQQASSDWHIPASTVVKAGLMNAVAGPTLTIPGQKPKPTALMYTEIEDASTSTPIILHYSEDGLLGAYDLTGQLIIPQNIEQQEVFKKLVSLNQTLDTLIQVQNHKDAGSSFGALFDGGIVKTDDQKSMKSVFKVKDQQSSRGSVTLPGPGTLNVTKRSGRIGTTLLGKVASALTGGGLGSIDSITVYTVSESQAPQLHTAELFDGERFLGFEMSLNTGVTTKVMISDFDGNPKSIVLPTADSN
ncbi:MAG: hypothetical protein J7501_10470 [Bdellovibrio sp.]|nr:hypothetical protein [Bdellovibrio sp.]